MKPYINIAPGIAGDHGSPERSALQGWPEYRPEVVHPFVWKIRYIAKQCENFLGLMGAGGFQDSQIHKDTTII